MKNFNFLFKPIFFICSLLFATWLVMEIEKISPSRFPGNNTRNDRKTYNVNNSFKRAGSKKYLQHLFTSYKTGMIDSIRLDEKLTFFLDIANTDSLK